jgi:hypothetical protein
VSHDQKQLIGSLLVLALLVVVVGGPLYVLAKVMPRIKRAQRRRQIETAMRLGVADRELMDEVAGQLYYEREGRS